MPRNFSSSYRTQITSMSAVRGIWWRATATITSPPPSFPLSEGCLPSVIPQITREQTSLFAHNQTRLGEVLSLLLRRHVAHNGLVGGWCPISAATEIQFAFHS